MTCSGVRDDGAPQPAAPGPLEEYAARFDDLFTRVAQRRGFREYLAGLLAPPDRNKTLTALAGAEPVTGAQHPAVQGLQFFLSESRWDPDAVNARRLELLRADPATAPHDAGVLVVDDSGDRKDGTKTAHVGHQWLGRYGRPAAGWSPSPRCGPTSSCVSPGGRGAVHPGEALREGEGRSGVPDQAGDRRGPGHPCAGGGVRVLRGMRGQRLRGSGRVPRRACAGWPAVRHGPETPEGTWAYGPDAHTPVDAARVLAWGGPEDPVTGSR